MTIRGYLLYHYNLVFKKKNSTVDFLIKHEHIYK